MSVIHQAGGNTLPRQPTQRAKPKPQCTHVTMDRMYGPYCCDNCRQPSPLGWLYKCSQDSIDEVEQQLSWMRRVDYVVDHPVKLSPQKTNKSIALVEKTLQALGFSESIITQFDAGVYTMSQVETLMAQRQHLCEVIKSTPSPSPVTPAKPPSSTINSTVKTSLETANIDYPTNLPFRTFSSLREPLPLPPTSVAKASHEPLIPPKKPALEWIYKPCMAKFCQRCRPYLLDRCWTSFDAVFNDELRPLSIADTRILPIKSPTIARTLGDTGYTFEPDGLGPVKFSEETTPTSATSDTFPYTECNSSEDEDSVSGDWKDEFDSTHRTNEQGTTLIYSAARHAVSTPDHFMQRTIRRVSGSVDDSSPTRSISSGSTLSLPTPTTARTSPIHPCFEDEGRGVSRIENGSLCQDKSPSKSASAVDENEFDLLCCFPESDKYVALYPSRNRAAPSDLGLVSMPNMSRSSSLDSLSYLGCELEVEGGVALTEEAIRTHTPDLINQDSQ